MVASSSQVGEADAKHLEEWRRRRLLEDFTAAKRRAEVVRRYIIVVCVIDFSNRSQIMFMRFAGEAPSWFLFFGVGF